MITVKNIHRVLNSNKIIIAHCLLTNKKYNFHIQYSFHIIFEKERKECDTYSCFKNINKYLQNSKNICVKTYSSLLLHRIQCT